MQISLTIAQDMFKLFNRHVPAIIIDVIVAFYAVIMETTL